MEISYHFHKLITLIICSILLSKCEANDILGCGGFVKSHANLDYSKIEIGLYTKEGSLKEKTECAPTNGYYFLPLYEKGEYVLKVHPPAGWSFEPSEVAISVDGVTDRCSSGQDVNFSFNGFGITGRVITAGQGQGPAGVAVQLVNEKGDERNTVTTVGGDFSFTPVIPGKYTIKASHPRWKLDPSQAIVQVTEGNTGLKTGVLAVKGYEVVGSVSSFGTPMSGVYVVLYSKEESPKFRVEGCKTALLQGVPDSPICHSITDASGEFRFGLVPAGEYKLLALSKTPGQNVISYNIKPDHVEFIVKHDSLYIKNAFEVTGFTIVGSVSLGGATGATRILVDGMPVASADAGGKFTLPNLLPGRYAVGAQNEKCEFDDITLTVTPLGPSGALQLRAARWRVCGAVRPARPVRLGPRGPTATPDAGGNWCIFLAPGEYTMSVDVTEREQREGLQYYPLARKISVEQSPIEDITFSQLKGTVSGQISCLNTDACRTAPVGLRTLAPDGGYVGKPMYTEAKDGKYKFTEVLPGIVEVSVDSSRLCWESPRHQVSVTQQVTIVPAFVHTGYLIRFHVDYDMEVDYTVGTASGTLEVPGGASAACVSQAGRVTLTPRSCRRYQPPSAVALVGAEPPTVYFTSVAHEVTVVVYSPSLVDDLYLDINARAEGPLSGEAASGGGVRYSHTMYMSPGEVAVVSARSGSLVFHPQAPQQVISKAECQPEALVLRAARGVVVKGQIDPPTDGVTVSLTQQGNDDLKLTYVTGADGTYSFGPLDASGTYRVRADKDSHVFSEPDDAGRIRADRLAEITVTLVDDADGAPLQGCLVSVSGGSYRRNLVSSEAALRFPRLAPADYFVKPHMKEYRFSPPHHIVHVAGSDSRHLTVRGVRVAWSLGGTLQSLGGAGWCGATVYAASADSAAAAACPTEEAVTQADGVFRIRGLLPNCEYTLQLKESNSPELAGLKLVKAPPAIVVKENKDIENVRLIAIQPQQLTDTNVLIYTPNIEHYKSLRLTLTLDASNSPLYSTKLDPTGYTQNSNPGLMYVLPRLPADNKTYSLQLESSLSKATHSYGDQVYYFNSDGQFKHFTIQFLPEVKQSEQELRQTSFLVIPFIGLLVLAYLQQDKLLAKLANVKPWPVKVTKYRADESDTFSVVPKKAVKKKTL